VRFERFQERYAPAIQCELARQLERLGEPQLRAAAGHLLGRGKLFRPLLALAACRAVSGGDPGGFVPMVAPLELIHTFTLIHDDLPCMDNAALRRGVSTVHLAFGEAAAVLAGDALLALAMHSLAQETRSLPARLRLKAITAATMATTRVVEGQVMDLKAEGGGATADEVRLVYEHKTGALLGACCEIGALLGGAGAKEALSLRQAGVQIGVAFQVRDDLLSLTGSEEVTGKTLGTDEQKAKSTYPRLLGSEAAEEYITRLIRGVARDVNRLGLRKPGLLKAMAKAAAWRER